MLLVVVLREQTRLGGDADGMELFRGHRAGPKLPSSREAEKGRYIPNRRLVFLTLGSIGGVLQARRCESLDLEATRVALRL